MRDFRDNCWWTPDWRTWASMVFPSVAPVLVTKEQAAELQAHFDLPDAER